MRKLTDREVLILELIFCGLPLVYYLLRLPFMPETVPVHWNASGEADRFAGRFCFDTVLSGAIGYFGLLFGIGLRCACCSPAWRSISFTAPARRADMARASCLNWALRSSR